MTKKAQAANFFIPEEQCRQHIRNEPTAGFEKKAFDGNICFTGDILILTPNAIDLKLDSAYNSDSRFVKKVTM